MKLINNDCLSKSFVEDFIDDLEYTLIYEEENEDFEEENEEKQLIKEDIYDIMESDDEDDIPIVQKPKLIRSKVCNSIEEIFEFI